MLFSDNFLALAGRKDIIPAMMRQMSTIETTHIQGLALLLILRP
jgi:hypothetical protein